ncbi:MAG: type II secretion system F family protein [Thermodesulfobacteriota bacterium]
MGKSLDGRIEAPTLQGAGDQLYQLGYLPISIEEEEKPFSLNLSELRRRFQKVNLEELILFTQQLSTLYKAGLPLLTGLESLKEQTENKKLKETITGICKQIEGGSTLFGSMSKYPEVFSQVYVNMVRAGEVSGRLGESLDRFVALADRELRIRQKVRDATRYPKIVIISVVLAFIVLIFFVFPRFSQVFSRFNTPLPLPTRVMIGINHVFQSYWYIFLSFLLIIPLFLKNYLRTEAGRHFWERIKMGIPVFGSLFLAGALSRFAHTLVMLNRSGIPILQGLEITSRTIQNLTLSESIEKIIQKVKEGRSLADAMRETGKFTPLVIQMVSVGESSGTLDEMMMRVTEYYDLQLENAIKKLSSYIEPLLTLFLGLIVLFLALAVFLPWWNMASLFR